MAVYRAYLMDCEGHITAAEVIEADCDERALEIAKQYVDGHDVELWDGARKVAHLITKH
jgi:hypothetical protein